MHDFLFKKRFSRFEMFIVLPIMAECIHYLVSGHL
jgi:hypothetical protein